MSPQLVLILNTEKETSPFSKIEGKLKVYLGVDQINDLIHKNDLISEKDIIDIYDQFSI